MEEHNQRTVQTSIHRAICTMRGFKVMLDADLARLYGVEVRVLNQAVKRNIERFPSDFMFRLTPEEAVALRSQFVILKDGRGQHSKFLPNAFTEQGVAMLSSVLRSTKAVQVNILIMRSFVRLRQMAISHIRIAQELDKLRNRVDVHDASINAIMDALSELVSPASKPSGKIGFRPEE
jgi:hypothetical protein